MKVVASKIVLFLFMFFFFAWSSFKAVEHSSLLWCMRAFVGLVGSICVFRSAPHRTRDTSTVALFVSWASVICPLLYSYNYTDNNDLYLVLTVAGLAISGISLLELDKSFGIVPGFRELKTSGLYRIVRHPIYAGYLLASLGWLLYTPSLGNCFVYLAQFFFTVTRIHFEERLLQSSCPEYAEYKNLTKFKLIPLVF
ncbi:MAG: hypothetical protein RL189_2026 [Pseudomonadota bacterium]|jgi:protein-S-isoprenylcysteine O-methyltransferase Ste14